MSKFTQILRQFFYGLANIVFSVVIVVTAILTVYAGTEIPTAVGFNAVLLFFELLVGAVVTVGAVYLMGYDSYNADVFKMFITDDAENKRSVLHFTQQNFIPNKRYRKLKVNRHNEEITTDNKLEQKESTNKCQTEITTTKKYL